MTKRRVKFDRSSKRRHGSGGFQIEILFPGLAAGSSTDSGIGTIGRIDHARVQPGTLISMHPHRDDEILTYLRSGRVRHSDTVGRAEEISPARLMLMNAGAEFQHEELVDEAGGTLHALQIFFRPGMGGLSPKVQFVDLDAPDSENAWRWLAGPEDRAPLQVRSHSWLEDGKFYKDTGLGLPPSRRPGLTRLLYVFDGAIRMGDLMIESGESVLLTADDRRLDVETTSTLVLFSTDENEPCFRGGMFSGNLVGS